MCLLCKQSVNICPETWRRCCCRLDTCWWRPDMPVKHCYYKLYLTSFGELVWSGVARQCRPDCGNQNHQGNRGIFLSQPTLTRTILEDNGFLTSSAATSIVSGVQLITSSIDAEPVDQSKYLSLIASLSYLAVGTRPVIAFVVNYLARFSARPHHDHRTALKYLLWYLSSTREDRIWGKNDDVNEKLDVFCDENWGGENHQDQHMDMLFFFLDSQLDGCHGVRDAWQHQPVMLSICLWGQRRGRRCG